MGELDKEKYIKFVEQTDLANKRDNKVVKHNALVQKSRFTFSVVEQKTINFLVSLVKPQQDCTEVQPLEYEFDIKTYCKICGIDYAAGKNYKMVRDTLKIIRDKSVIMTKPDGTDTSVSWINKFWSNKGSGKAKIRFDEDIAPFIFAQCNNTTRFSLINVLPMKSKYSVRMYEICRSWAGLKTHMYELNELRRLLCIPDDELVRYPDFKRRVLDASAKEINEHTDLNIRYEPVTKGRKVIKIKIHIKEKPLLEVAQTRNRVNQLLNKE